MQKRPSNHQQYWKVAPQKVRIYGKANAKIFDVSLSILEEILVSIIQARSAPLNTTVTCGEQPSVMIPELVLANTLY